MTWATSMKFVAAVRVIVSKSFFQAEEEHCLRRTLRVAEAGADP